jgi:hypothetical protein
MGGKRNKGNKRNSPDKGNPSDKGDSADKGLPPEEDKTDSIPEPESNVALMLQGRGFEIVNSDRIKDTERLNEDTRATVLEKLLEHKATMCRVCVMRLDKSYGKLDIAGKFGQWLTTDSSNEIHVHIPLNVFYDMDAEDPFIRMSVRKSNIAISIREGLKNRIESMVKSNAATVSCTDIDRLLLVVEEMEITYFPLQDDGSVDRTAIPLVLDRNSDLTKIFKEHVIHTTTGQIMQPSPGVITFAKQFVYGFRIDALRITMPP